jgi:predicted flap endonuclease-1-like 5' DNA nuclease
MASYAAVAAAAAAAGAMAAAEPAVPAASEPEPEPQPEPEPAPPAASAVEAPPAAPLPADDLKRIRGIERVLEGRLNNLGVRRFADIAAWTAADVTRVNQSLGLTGRIEQENWIEQAQILARGVDTEYSRRQRISQTTMAAGVAAAAASAAASATAQKSAGPDRFTRIIGIDAETEQALHAMGYTRYSEMAHWTSSDIEKVEDALNRPGRVGLDNWVEQARVLARYAGETEARPARLIDAIRENREAGKPADPTPARTDLAGLRSVRSQALRGETPVQGGRVEDLKRIRGIGVLIEKRLNALGVVSYEQIANWTGADIDSISNVLDFKGRIERENWIEQARILASGGQTEFSRRVDRGEVESSRES